MPVLKPFSAFLAYLHGFAVSRRFARSASGVSEPFSEEKGSETSKKTLIPWQNLKFNREALQKAPPPKQGSKNSLKKSLDNLFLGLFAGKTERAELEKLFAGDFTDSRLVDKLRVNV